jgi:hypothetical protein
VVFSMTNDKFPMTNDQSTNSWKPRFTAI